MLFNFVSVLLRDSAAAQIASNPYALSFTESSLLLSFSDPLNLSFLYLLNLSSCSDTYRCQFYKSKHAVYNYVWILISYVCSSYIAI